MPFSSGISAALGPLGNFVKVTSYLIFCPMCWGPQLCSKYLNRPNLFTKIPRASLNSFPVTGGFIVSNIAYSQCVTGWESLVKLRFPSNRNWLSLGFIVHVVGWVFTQVCKDNYSPTGFNLSLDDWLSEGRDGGSFFNLYLFTCVSLNPFLPSMRQREFSISGVKGIISFKAVN